MLFLFTLYRLFYLSSTVHSGFFYKTAEEREKMVKAETKFIEERVQKIIDLKRKVCTEEGQNFVVVNAQGIDPNSLDMFAREGITALRRAKRRNMERLTKACGGKPMNTVDDLTPDCLGWAGDVWEYTLGEDKFTFVEDCKNPQSVTILIKGPNKHSMVQIKDAINDGLRAIKNAIEDGCLVPGAGAFEVGLAAELERYKLAVEGKAQLGVQAYADAVAIIPKILAFNSGFDQQEVMIKLIGEYNKLNKDPKAAIVIPVGIDLDSGEPMNPTEAGVFDNFRVKKQLIYSW